MFLKPRCEGEKNGLPFLIYRLQPVASVASSEESSLKKVPPTPFIYYIHKQSKQPGSGSKF